MKNRVLITTVAAFLLLAAVIAAGVNAVFTVTLVKTEFSVFSEEGEREAEALKAQIDKFVGSSTTFLDLGDVQSVVDGYPCMRVDRIEKKYPSTVEVEISERKESFALKTQNGYAILADDGFYLYEKETAASRTGGDNILLEGFSLGPDGKTADSASFQALFELFSVFEEALGSARANILSVRYESALVYDSFTVAMQEGIQIEILSPTESCADKARAALFDERYGYLVRSDAERLCGCITVGSGKDGIQVDYDFHYDFPSL